MNITLIGMPGAGKSTIGRKLARNIGREFVDTDRIIEERAGKKLQEILAESEEQFRIFEEEALIKASEFDGVVIATGGSAIFSKKGMAALKKSSVIVCLHIMPGEVEKRIARNAPVRGIWGFDKKTIKEIYEERKPFYFAYADAVVSVGRISATEAARIIMYSI